MAYKDQFFNNNFTQGFPMRVGDFIFTKKDFLDKGATSQVYRATDEQGRKVAIKLFNRKDKQFSFDSALNEATTLSKFKSPYICEFISVGESQEYFFIIMSLVQGKTLNSYLKQKKKIDGAEAEKIFKSLLRAYEDLMAEGIMHRDLKLQNIIYNGQNTVLVDFGLACKINKNDPLVMTICAGTPLYMSPQILKRQKYNSKSDIWSLGIILYQLLYGYLPYGGKSDKEVLKSIQNTKNIYPKNDETPFHLKRILNRCLNVDLWQRAEWKDLFEWGRTGVWPGENKKSKGCSCL